jgi:hypothetical protein
MHSSPGVLWNASNDPNGSTEPRGDSNTLFPDDAASQRLPPFPEPGVNALGESSQQTDITSIVELRPRLQI